ncbi:undecaprenyl-diphosphate phosphatase [Rudaeicoccus suwonensis]|uniref:Undecaprenyl-diphosphatase n=1 Tax=Rudaeicoccus suwonensis TaxID=657409 RepID=A0A561ECU9_9MICO|nr:undecaprenyl-diphosphate phosphatase [Rudaeicoccus suwonensis]TWE13407.1 undecaprenyl-diphosphatase [Rudaeicoccus suwonensis]
MTWAESLVLGIVQGLTEFLPISSSAHQLIVARLFWNNDGGGAAFTAVSQLGTEAAVLVYFRNDIVRIVRRWLGSVRGSVPRSDPDARMGWLVIVGTIPIAVLGVALKGVIEGPLRNLWVTASMLVAFAIVLAIADATASQRKELGDLSKRDGLLFGLWQALALIPGVSRSGGTISGGLLMGYTRASAARYSFLLAVPAVLASGLFELGDVGGTSADGWAHIALATVIAFAIGYAVIAWLMRYISSHSFRPFVYYRLGLAAFLFGMLLTDKIAA